MILVQFAAATLVLLATLFVLGLPLAILLHRRVEPSLLLTSVPFLGFFVVGTVAWYAADHDVGVSSAFRVTLGGAVIGTILLSLWPRTRPRDLVAFRLAATEIAVAVLLQVLIFTLAFVPLGRVGSFTSMSIGNNDIASYALVSSHLADHGFSSEDGLPDVNLSYSARTDVFGAYVLLAVASAATARPIWKITMPAMALAVLLMFLAIRLLAMLVFGLSSGIAVVIALASTSTYFFLYFVAEYFFAQVFGMATFAFLLATLLSLCGTKTDSSPAAIGVLVAAGAGVLILVYPHMLLYGAPILVGVPASAAIGCRQWSSFVRVSLVAFVGAVLGAATLAPRAHIAIAHALALRKVQAGWKIPSPTFADLLGFQRGISATPSGVNRAGSLAIGAVALVVIMVVVRQRRSAGLVAGLLLLAVLVSHSLIRHSEGSDAYVQAKWISFFQPLIVLVVFGSVVLAVAPLVARAPYRVKSWGAFVSGAFLALTLANGRLPLAPMFNGRAATVTPAMATIGEGGTFREIRSVNINLANHWETLWAMYFLRDVQRFVLSTNYYPLSPAPVAPWTVAKAGEAPPQVTPPIRLNGEYELVANGGPPIRPQ